MKVANSHYHLMGKKTFFEIVNSKFLICAYINNLDTSKIYYPFVILGQPGNSVKIAQY